MRAPLSRSRPPLPIYDRAPAGVNRAGRDQAAEVGVKMIADTWRTEAIAAPERATAARARPRSL